MIICSACESGEKQGTGNKPEHLEMHKLSFFSFLRVFVGLPIKQTDVLTSWKSYGMFLSQHASVHFVCVPVHV